MGIKRKIIGWGSTTMMVWLLVILILAQWAYRDNDVTIERFVAYGGIALSGAFGVWAILTFLMHPRNKGGLPMVINVNWFWQKVSLTLLGVVLSIRYGQLYLGWLPQLSDRPVWEVTCLAVGAMALTSFYLWMGRVKRDGTQSTEWIETPADPLPLRPTVKFLINRVRRIRRNG